MNALVIGCGSAGTRHARILGEMGLGVAVVSTHAAEQDRVYADLSNALHQEDPAYVVVANRTDRHFQTVEALAAAGFAGKVLVEKPIFDHMQAIPENTFQSLSVAYNLRFHPVIAALREKLANERALSVTCYVGQYLPDWRPTRDYRTGYSASKAEGGGAIRDLSHELDYLNWLLGPWHRLTALGGQFSPLEIDSDDTFAVLAEMEHCPVTSIEMNYLDRVGRRAILVNTGEHTFFADVIAGTLQLNQDTQKFDCEIDGTWRAEHAAVLAGDTEHLCSWSQALDVVRMIDAAETAAREGTWVQR